MNRIVAHKKALGAVIPCGIGRSHRANPASALRVLQLYGVPVLMSGVASLVLSKAELNIFEQHYKETVQNLQKLLPLRGCSLMTSLYFGPFWTPPSPHVTKNHFLEDNPPPLEIDVINK